MLTTPMRRRVLVLAALGLLPLVSPAPAAILDVSGNGQLVDPATWGGTLPSTGDTLNISQFTVSTTKVNGTSLPDDLVINLSGGKLAFDYDTNMSTQSVTLNFSGGTFENSRGQMFYGGVALNITGTTTYNTASNAEVSHLGNSGAATSTVVTGSGTVIKTGLGVLELRSIVNVLDADSGTPGNQTRTNASTFNGTWDVQAGVLEVLVPEFVKFSTVKLGGTVAGTAADTNTDVSPRLSIGTNGATYAGTQLEAATLTGTGRIYWATTSGYYRDLAIGSTITPGTATEAGLIKRHTGGSSNDLVMRPGSTMAFDVLGPTAADADQVDWTDSTGVSGMVFSEANLTVRLYDPAVSTGVLSWVLINGDEWISKSTQGSSAATPIASQAFASVTFLDAAGNPLNLYTGPGDVDGGWDLGFTSGNGISYLGTMGSSNRQVVLTGEYIYVGAVDVPEPATLSVLGVGAVALLARRRRS